MNVVSLEVGSTYFIVDSLAVFGMLPTIDFDRQTTLWAKEIEEVQTYAELANELQAAHLPTA